jgi:hypothetical protein
MLVLAFFTTFIPSLGTGMTQPNKFRDRDDTDEQVWEPKRSIYEFRDQDDTVVQV